MLPGTVAGTLNPIGDALKEKGGLLTITSDAKKALNSLSWPFGVRDL